MRIMKEWIVTAKEDRSYRVSYIVKAITKDEARDMVSRGHSTEDRAEMTASLSQEIVDVEENI